MTAYTPLTIGGSVPAPTMYVGRSEWPEPDQLICNHFRPPDAPFLAMMCVRLSYLLTRRLRVSKSKGRKQPNPGLRCISSRNRATPGGHAINAQ